MPQDPLRDSVIADQAEQAKEILPVLDAPRKPNGVMCREQCQWHQQQIQDQVAVVTCCN
jgi:hypothetical protein